MAKKKAGRKDESATSPKKTASPQWNAVAAKKKEQSKSGMKASPSASTLARLERDGIVLWRRPITTLHYATMETLCMAWDFVKSLRNHKFLLFLLSTAVISGYVAYVTPGAHQEQVIAWEKQLLWWGWWVLLGVLSSIGLGSGLHTFLIYLGPHIAAVTLAAYECNSLDFPEPPYPESIVCPSKSSSSVAITLWQIVSKVRVESFLWGAGTALGELPPYFMARAARLSGKEPDDEEYQEFLEIMHGAEKNKHMSLMDRCKAWMERAVTKMGFFGILVFASVPNPLFDLAGITCGHFLVPFWTFFGATLIGKAVVKMHVQMLVVIIAFSEHHVENVVKLLAKIPHIGHMIQDPIREVMAKQKAALHRAPGTHVEQSSTWLQTALGGLVTTMILFFLLSIINSFAQSYHKRLSEQKSGKKKSQ